MSDKPEKFKSGHINFLEWSVTDACDFPAVKSGQRKKAVSRDRRNREKADFSDFAVSRDRRNREKADFADFAVSRDRKIRKIRIKNWHQKSFSDFSDFAVSRDRRDRKKAEKAVSRDR